TPTPTPTPTPTGDNATTLYDGEVHLEEKQNADGTWSLDDTTRGQGVVTRDANNAKDNSKATEFHDDNGVWGEKTDSARETSAPDAHYAAEMTYDFYKSMFGRDSIDGKGLELVSNVHIDKNFVNAFWDGEQMNYGDGDGKNSGPLTSLDIGGHEISHGFTQYTANLVYSGESGGLNEAMSDIFGKGVQWFASQQNKAVPFSWGVGEQVWTPGTPGDALRYMDDPTKDGGSIDNYKKYSSKLDVHCSSGIANNAFVLMAQGGTNRTSGQTVDASQSLGMQKALQVMYRAETVYFTPNETFPQAGQACVKAATDLYGADSQEVKTVTAAWKAVGCL
ncbi:MAG TPA: M4 family metallopeptidase, partial [Anaeromyxobacteraceae bacterium]|nr:M4 family metallopeptidase [Anaeromyxobacteraceae bacterium]